MGKINDGKHVFPSKSKFGRRKRKSKKTLQTGELMKSGPCEQPSGSSQFENSHRDDESIPFSGSDVSTSASSRGSPIPPLENIEDVAHSPKKGFPELTLDGRRIADIQYLFRQIFEVSKHPPFDCTLGDMYIKSEQRIGLKNKILLQCRMCNMEKYINLIDDSTDALDINDALVLGAISTGIGYSTSNELFSVLNIPFMTSSTYQKHHEKVSDIIHTISWQSMEEAGKEEFRLAEERGHVNELGVPLIAVVADGAWSKRSYSTNYDASSGVACIIGANTRKILFLGVRNKYCTVCARSESKGIPIPEHRCYKNWTQTSTAMEADIIVEGFKKSQEMHGVIYQRLIGDGDSSVFKRILETRPYGNFIVEKIECRNHLLRNFSKKIREVCVRKRSNSKNVPVLPMLRNLVKNNAHRMRYCISSAINFRINQEEMSFCEKVSGLCRDLKNIPYHVFGEHTQCKDLAYFKCSTETKVNQIPVMKDCGLLEDIEICINRLIVHAHSLITNMNNNVAELYNSVVCKFVGGKRINFSLKSSYQTRCEAAAISFNSSGDYYNQLGLTANSLATRKYSDSLKKRRTIKCRTKRKLKKSSQPDEHYGPEANPEPDLPLEIFEEKKTEFLTKLKKTKDEIQILEKSTRGQAKNPLWKTERMCRLTASNFGEICKMRQHTPCTNKIKNLLYSTFSGTDSTQYGQEYESCAIKKFEEEYNIKVVDCGFFVDEEHCFLGATPDGLIGTNGIIEVKCPKVSSKIHPREAIATKVIKFATLDENLHMQLKKTHNYFYQIQGQLHVTKRNVCHFVVWSPIGIMVEKIFRDDSFWENKMLPKLEGFYYTCMLPELIDPRFTRNMEIRNPLRTF